MSPFLHLSSLRAAVEGTGLVVSVRSGDQYTLTAKAGEPVTYRGLLRELGHADELERHEQIARDLQL
jgi:hypothetical protein